MNNDLFLFLSVASVALFSFVAVASWSGERRREREAYYRSETIKKVAELQAAGGGSVMEFLRETEKMAALRRREGLKLGGLVTMAVAVALMIFLRANTGPADGAAYLVGLIPLFIGIVLLAYGAFFASKS